MSDDHTGRQFREELRKLQQPELDELYVRLRKLASYLLKNKFGHDVRTVEPEDLVHQTYLAVDTGHRGDGSASSLFQYLSGVMSSELHHVVRPASNTAVHLSIAAPQSDDDDETVNLDGLAASPSSDPEARLIASEWMRRVVARFTESPLVLRYIALRVGNDGATVAEDAVALGVPEKKVRNIRKVLARTLWRLREEDGLQ